MIVRCLENEGVSHVFGIPGEENIHLVEALSRSTIRYVLVRHVGFMRHDSPAQNAAAQDRQFGAAAAT